MRKEEIKLEIRRQIVHSLGVFTIVPIFLLGKNISTYLIGILVAILFSLSIYRSYRKKVSWPLKIFNEIELKIEREICKYERRNEFPLRGALFFYLGIFLIMLLFNKEIVITSIIILSISDALSTLVGKIYGKHKLHINKIKSFEGSLAFFISSLFLLYFIGYGIYSIPLATVITFIEMLPKIDDNLSIPICMAIFLYILETFI